MRACSWQLHELELNDMVEVGPDGELRYNRARIVSPKAQGGAGWKWLLGIILLIFVFLPSWLHS